MNLFHSFKKGKMIAWETGPERKDYLRGQRLEFCLVSLYGVKGVKDFVGSKCYQ